MQTSTIDKDKVNGSKSGGQKLGADAATPGEHKPQTKPNRRKKRVASEQGKRAAQTCITGGKTMQKPARQNQHTPCTARTPPTRTTLTHHAHSLLYWISFSRGRALNQEMEVYGGGERERMQL
jgi:hypothetical protein